MRREQRFQRRKDDPNTEVSTVVTYEVSSTAVTCAAPAVTEDVSNAKKPRSDVKITPRSTPVKNSEQGPRLEKGVKERQARM